jgi:hypothetical protein
MNGCGKEDEGAGKNKARADTQTLKADASETAKGVAAKGVGAKGAVRVSLME